jgi:hypothetical protein
MKNRMILGAAFAALMLGLSGCAMLAPTFRTDLTSTMTAAKPQLSQCYAQGLARNPKLAGDVTVQLTVKRSTTALTDVTVMGPQPSDPDFEQCVAKVAGGLSVPNAPHLTVRASYPISFTPAQ